MICICMCIYMYVATVYRYVILYVRLCIFSTRADMCRVSSYIRTHVQLMNKAGYWFTEVSTY